MLHKGFMNIVESILGRYISNAQTQIKSRRLICTYLVHTPTKRNSILLSNNQTHRKINIKRKRPEITELDSRFNMEWPKVSLFGDSITRRSFDCENGCWGSMLAFKLGAYFDVDARGFEGYNTRWALELMPKLFPKNYLDKVEIFVSFFGHNDAWGPMKIPVEEFETNTRSIVKYLEDNGLSKEKIILMTPSWYDHEGFSKYSKEIGFPGLGKEFDETKKYSEAVLRVGSDNNISVLDFMDISAKYEPLGELFCDGVHFSHKGAKLLYDNLLPIVKKKIETQIKKPIDDLCHAVPFYEKPEVDKVLGPYVDIVKKVQTHR